MISVPVTSEEEIIVGAASGAMVPLLLRQYKDKPVPTARLGPFEASGLRRPSVFGSIGLGTVATIFGLMGARGKGPLGANVPASHTAAAFGGAAIMGGVGSWMYPPEEVVPPGVALRVAKPAVTLAARAVVPEVAVGPEIGRPRLRRAETPSGEALGGF